MKSTTIWIGVGLMVLAAAGAARADWKQGDPYKMHYPQLPDPNGWDVGWCHTFLADDFQCTQTGPITDVHLWTSVQNDDPGVDITSIHLSIHADVPKGLGNPFSHPGASLWADDFGPSQFTMREVGTGDQGWYAPFLVPPYWLQGDHAKFYQINITNIPNPFDQVQGTTYWLDVQGHVGVNSPAVGWKTSQDHWNDDAVWWDSVAGQWRELTDPVTFESLDMAFVITPEPATLALMGLGLAGLVARRRRK